MPTCVGGYGLINGINISVSRKCTAQNVRSATMGEPSAAVAAQIIGRMILVSVLVWGYCLTGCLGVFPPPPPFDVIQRALDTAGQLETMRQVSDVTGADDDRFESVNSPQTERSIVINHKPHDQRFGQSHRDRANNLKKLLELLAVLQHRHLPQSSGDFDDGGHKRATNSIILDRPKTLNQFFHDNVDQYNEYDIDYPPHEDISFSLNNKYTDMDHDLIGADSVPKVPSHFNDIADDHIHDDSTDEDAEDEDEDDDRYFDELFSHDQEQDYNGADDVTAAVIAALTSGTVPRDSELWRNITSILDSHYLTRTRRSLNRRLEIRKRLRQQMRARLSITYGHVMPCEYKDRLYCMNGGTCVFVGALDIKTCRCPIGYTGIRCEMIDQEYILSLLTNSIIFS